MNVNASLAALPMLMVAVCMLQACAYQPVPTVTVSADQFVRAYELPQNERRFTKYRGRMQDQYVIEVWTPSERHAGKFVVEACRLETPELSSSQLLAMSQPQQDWSTLTPDARQKALDAWDALSKPSGSSR